MSEEALTQEEVDRIAGQIRRLKFTVALWGMEGEIYDPVDGVDQEDWPVRDVVPFYRADLTTGEDETLRRRFLEGPHSHDLEAFNKMLDAIFIEIRIEALKQFPRIVKPHDRVDAWNARKEK